LCHIGQNSVLISVVELQKTTVRYPAAVVTYLVLRCSPWRENVCWFSENSKKTCSLWYYVYLNKLITWSSSTRKSRLLVINMQYKLALFFFFS